MSKFFLFYTISVEPNKENLEIQQDKKKPKKQVKFETPQSADLILSEQHKLCYTGELENLLINNLIPNLFGICAYVIEKISQLRKNKNQSTKYIKKNWQYCNNTTLDSVGEYITSLIVVSEKFKNSYDYKRADFAENLLEYYFNKLDVKDKDGFFNTLKSIESICYLFVNCCTIGFTAFDQFVVYNKSNNSQMNPSQEFWLFVQYFNYMMVLCFTQLIYNKQNLIFSLLYFIIQKYVLNYEGFYKEHIKKFARTDTHELSQGLLNTMANISTRDGYKKALLYIHQLYLQILYTDITKEQKQYFTTIDKVDQISDFATYIKKLMKQNSNQIIENLIFQYLASEIQSLYQNIHEQNEKQKQ
jgi:hypothetical protein